MVLVVVVLLIVVLVGRLFLACRCAGRGDVVYAPDVEDIDEMRMHGRRTYGMR